MSHEVKATKDLENKTLTIEREFDASKDKVWNAYADKATFEKWWGPEGWETTAKEFNLASGGRIHYGMHCVDKDQGEWYDQWSWGLMEVTEVVASDSFSYVDYFSNEEGTVDKTLPVLTITNTFTEQDGVTKLVSVSHADSAEHIEQLLQMGMVEGFTSQLLKLDALLAK